MNFVSLPVPNCTSQETLKNSFFHEGHEETRKKTTSRTKVAMLRSGENRRVCNFLNFFVKLRVLRGSYFFSGILLPLLLLAGCAVGPDFVRPEAPAVDAYTQGPLPLETVEAAGTSQRFFAGRDIAADWWFLFQCEELNAVIDEALSGSRDLQAAQARLRESQELLRAGYGVFFPQVDGSFDFTRQKFTASRFGGGFGSSIFNLYSASLAATYNLDVFGGSRRQVEGQAAQVDVQDAQVKATYLTLLGNVINTVIARAGYRAQIAATEELIAFERRQVEITQTKYDAGMIARTQVLSLRTQVASTEATLPPLRQRLDQASHLLATLTGRFPAESSLPVVDLDNFILPDELPLSLPSALVRQRPDILTSEATLHRASAEIGVATANLFPSISLSAGYGQESTKPDYLFKSMSNIWNWGGGLTQPLFHGGSLWFQRRAAVEAYNAALADYQQTVLTAFAEVADALRALEHDAQALKARIESLESAQQNLLIVQGNYEAGIASYLEVLIANLQYQQAKLLYIQSRAQRLQDTAVLFTALGGGWWNLSEGLER
jgi:NodT family efflux transporter outer membrane factor (OMF) lipoprotein